MTEIIHIDHACFFARRPKELINSQVTLRIENLLNMYACFNSDRSVRLHHIHGLSAHAHTQFRSSKRYTAQVIEGEKWINVQSEPIKERKRLVPSDETPEYLEMRALLNKITGVNYQRVSIQILQISSKSPSQDWIVAFILQKCCKQSFFSDVFLRLIKDIIKTKDGTAESPGIANQMTAFAKQTLELPLDLYLPLVNDIPQSKDYDYFCDRGALKREMLGQAKTLIGLIECDLVTSTRLEFLSRVIVVIKALFKDNQTSLRSCNIDEHVDVALEYMRMILSAMPVHERTSCLKGEVEGIRETLHQSSCSCMCKFKLQGILELPWRDLDPQVNSLCLGDQDDGADLWTTTAMLRLHLRSKENMTNLRDPETHPRRVVGRVVHKARAF